MEKKIQAQNKLIEQIRQSYLDARIVKFPSKNNSIFRGTSHSISSITEDLFGKYCADLLPANSDLEIWIDPQVSFKISGLKSKSGKKSLLYRPDVCFMRNGVITTIFDLKTDLGYRRKEIVKQAKQLNQTCKKILGKAATVKNGITKIPMEIKISKNLRKCFVILSSENIVKGQLQKSKIEIKKKYNIDVFVLVEGHLNTYSINGGWVLNDSDFKAMDKLIKGRTLHRS